MARTWSEEKVLKKLGISDFRHMTKDKVVQFASMLHRMDPQVAMKVLDQFPHYTQLATEMVGIYRDVAKEILVANTSSMMPFYNACNSILTTLQKELEDTNITPDERATINRQMIEVARMIGEKDTENKHFLASVGKWVGGAAVFVIGIAATVLGVSKLSGHDDDSFDA